MYELFTLGSIKYIYKIYKVNLFHAVFKDKKNNATVKAENRA